MPTYISLVQFTDQGIRAAKDTTHRLAERAAKVKSRGGSALSRCIGHWAIMTKCASSKPRTTRQSPPCY